MSTLPCEAATIRGVLLYLSLQLTESPEAMADMKDSMLPCLTASYRSMYCVSACDRNEGVSDRPGGVNGGVACCRAYDSSRFS